MENVLFKGIEDYDCIRMVECMSPIIRKFKSGETLYNFDDKSGLIGLIMEGSAALERFDENGVRTILENIYEEDIFGENIAFSGYSKDNISVRALTDCTVFFIGYNKIVHMCSNKCGCHSIIIENMFYIISEKLINLSQRVEVLSRRSIREKLLCYFNLMSERRHSDSFDIPFNNTALADYLCVDRSAMLRELRKIKLDGIASLEKRHVTLYRS